MADFIPGLKLSELFYQEVVKDILEKQFPRLAYSAGLIGFGSDVIGFDTALSTDHMWGPRLYLFLSKEDEPLQSEISATLSRELPYTFKGYSVNFSRPDPTDNGIQWRETISSGPVNHLINICTIEAFFDEYLNCDPFGDISIADWFTFTEHRLLAVTAGGLFHDDLGLEAVRRKLAYFPHVIWLYMLASQWAKIAEEEAFVGRCGDVGDEIGSRIVTARIVHSLMRLCFMMEKQYAPYSKWFGSGFARLVVSADLNFILGNVLGAETWPERQHFMSEAYRIVAGKHNALQLTDPLSTDVVSYHGRPYQVIFAGRFADEIRKVITDQAVRNIEANLGSVSQFSDSVSVYDNLTVCDRLKGLYRPKV